MVWRVAWTGRLVIKGEWDGVSVKGNGGCVWGSLGPESEGASLLAGAASLGPRWVPRWAAVPASSPGLGSRLGLP